VLGEIKRNRPPTLKAASPIRVKAGEYLFKEIWLIHWAFTTLSLPRREIGNWLTSMPHSVAPFMAIFPQVCKSPLHQLIGGDIGEITIHISRDLQRDYIGRRLIYSKSSSTKTPKSLRESMCH